MLTLMLAAAALAAPQAPARAPRGASVEGRVTNRVTGEPVRKAVVYLTTYSDTPADTYMAQADSNGRFRFEGVVPGPYRAFAEAARFTTFPDRAWAAPVPPLTVSDGQHLANVNIQMTPLGTVSGRVLDPDGDPVLKARVEAVQYVFLRGVRQLASMGMSAWTDDRGQYRLFDVRPGRHYIRALKDRQDYGRSGGPPPGPGFPLTYYPNAREPEETEPVEVAPGGDVQGVDIRLAASGVYSIRGTLKGAGDGPRSPPVLSIRRRSAFLPSTGAYPRVDGDSFEFMNVTPGSYVIVAEQRQGDERAFARRVIEVEDTDVEGIQLTLTPAAEARGLVRATGPLRQPIKGHRLRLIAVDHDPSTTERLARTIAAHELEGKVTVITGDFLAVELRGDVVLLEFCLHEMSDPRAAIDCARKTASDVVVIDHAPESKWAWYANEEDDMARAWDAVAAARPRMEAAYEALQRFGDHGELRDRLSACGPVSRRRIDVLDGRAPIAIAMPYRIALL